MLATIDYFPDFYLQGGLVLFGDGILVSLEPIVVLYPEMQIVNQLLMIFLIIFGFINRLGQFSNQLLEI